jgi:hypothetical protein
MPKLTATYYIRLPRYLRIKRPDSDALIYSMNINDFLVQIELVRNGGKCTKLEGERHFIRPIENINISVSREEASQLPDIIKDKNGNSDFSDRAEWMNCRNEEFKDIAVISCNRIIRYFKYKMNTPNLFEYKSTDDIFNNPAWEYDTHKNIDKGISIGIIEMSLHVIPGHGISLLGERDFTKDHDLELQEVLENDVDIETYQEFMSDAQASIALGKLSRAVIEIAIACEVLVKQTYFASDTLPGLAFEYFEDKRKINSRFIEFIDGVAKHSFGESFKEKNSNHFSNIDHLFRCRNKIVHKGKAIYHKDDGSENTIDKNTLQEWWASLEVLIEWICKLKSI